MRRTDLFLDLFGSGTGTRTRGRICTRCGGRHRDPNHQWCKVCRVLTASWRREYRHDHIKRKLCPECVQNKGRVTKTCEYHRKYHAALIREVYEDQRDKGLCGYSRCPVTSEAFYCDKHQAKHAGYRTRPARRWAA